MHSMPDSSLQVSKQIFWAGTYFSLDALLTPGDGLGYSIVIIDLIFWDLS
jgi:hypothetical protein